MRERDIQRQKHREMVKNRDRDREQGGTDSVRQTD